MEPTPAPSWRPTKPKPRSDRPHHLVTAGAVRREHHTTRERPRPTPEQPAVPGGLAAASGGASEGDGLTAGVAHLRGIGELPGALIRVRPHRETPDLGEHQPPALRQPLQVLHHVQLLRRHIQAGETYVLLSAIVVELHVTPIAHVSGPAPEVLVTDIAQGKRDPLVPDVVMRPVQAHQVTAERAQRMEVRFGRFELRLPGLVDVPKELSPPPPRHQRAVLLVH